MPESQTMNASRRSFLVPHLSEESREFFTCVFIGISLIFMFLLGLVMILYVLHSHDKRGLLGGMDG